jgi:DNA-binding phage protein
MKNVKVPTSDSWQDALIESLKDPQEAAGYIEAILEEKDPEPELLRAALKDVVDSRVQMNNLSEEAKLGYEKLDKMLLETAGAEIYSLVELLDALGFRIVITPKSDRTS